jgi:DNA processing protein
MKLSGIDAMDDTLTSRRALLILNALPNLGPITLRRLLEAFGGDPARALTASARELRQVKGVGEVIAGTIAAWREHFDPEREEQMLAACGGKFLVAEDAEYPSLLRDIHDPPIGLYCLGEYAGADRAVAIVGSRRATLYGQAVARRLAGDLARLGFWVVSGGARGIDATAHEGALEAGGKTAVVLGNGLDIVYPPEHLELFRRIAASGAVLSEFPLGRKADRQTFPMRNRLIAGMCRAVVVVESDVNGGSLITAAQAIEQGREVFAVPGRIDQVSSRGCHKLIREGEAKLITGVEDMLEEWGRDGQLKITLDQALPPAAAGPDAEALAALGEDGRRVYERLRADKPLHPDELAAHTDLPSARVAASLLLLELKRLIVKRADGRFEAR